MEFIDLKAQYHTLRPSINARIRAVLEHGHYIMGPEVQELEERLADYTGARHCLTVASGTEAMLIALMAIGLRPGDEVITTPFSFIATAEVIALLGGVPVFADIEADTCNIDATLIEQKITDRTRAIMPVSLFGQPSDMDAINAIAARHGLVVIEDGAQSFGSTYKGRRSGNLSSIGCTSFFPSKPLGCYGDGGAIFTSDDDLAEVMREIRVHGQMQRYRHSRIGVGGRMDTLQCAIVLAKLDRFDWEVEQRQLIAAHYDELFGNRVERVRQRPERTSVYAQYTVYLEERDAVRDALDKAHVPTAVHYPVPIPLQPAYRHFTTEHFPVSAQMSKRVLSLPMGPYLDVYSLTRVADLVLRAKAQSMLGTENVALDTASSG
jgi:UDP-2-acetamido-2-deoxy-ribo-hexuluronate aminotransferase